MSTFDALLDELRLDFDEISPADAYQQLLNKAAVLVDVRERDELDSGIVDQAVHLPKSMLELRAETALADKKQPLLLMCGSGVRSLLAAKSLQQLGYTQLRSVSGGMQRWKDEGLPIAKTEMLTAESRKRYARHILIPEVGEEGQLKLLASRVLLIGAGGLGSPAALYLAAAGVGTLGIIDNDVVEVSNLQRQVLHGEKNIGEKKVISAAKRLKDLNPHINIETYDALLDQGNVDGIFAKYDAIVDGCDNFQTRYLINDACLKHRKPNIHGAVYRFEGYLTVFDSTVESAPCYRCLYKTPPPPDLAPSCMEAGVLGVLPGVIGMLQAVETIKLLLNIGEPLVGRLLRYDALEVEFSELTISKDIECDVCSKDAKKITYQQYETPCEL